MNISEDFIKESCDIIRLSQEQISNYFGKVEIGEVDTITMVYDHINDVIILNSDHDLCEICSMLAASYILADQEKREKLKIKIPSFKEEVMLLDKIVLMRKHKDQEVAL